MPLYKERISSIYNLLLENNVTSVLELGCGTGRLLQKLAESKSFSKIVGIDNSDKRVIKAQKATKNYDVQILKQSFFQIENPNIFKNYDAIVASEVIEHLVPEDLEKLIALIFEGISPKIIVFTTPNKTYNCNYATLYNGFRHSSHVFEYDEIDIMKLIDNIIISYPMYSYKKIYCDENHATHLIIFKKEEKTYETN